jgi:RNA polymerase sigma-70 factor (ECF subfamily)
MEDLTQLLLAARDGDRLALGAAIRASQGEVWRFVRSLTGPEDADDVTQDVFLRAWRALPAFRGDASGRTWLLAIARRACADHVRRQVRARRLRQRLELAAATTDGSERRTADDGAALDDLVAGLRPERREAFVLTQVLGCSYQEAADVCGVPIGTIRSRVARARDDLLGAVRAADTA